MTPAQDTPGYGDFEDCADAEAQRDAVCAHLNACSERYYEAEADAARRVPAHGLPDCRVDVCLYFVQPHRLRRADVRYMRQLAALVPVVPVLAKVGRVHARVRPAVATRAAAPAAAAAGSLVSCRAALPLSRCSRRTPCPAPG